jgi:hypothetical protein
MTRVVLVTLQKLCSTSAVTSHQYVTSTYTHPHTRAQREVLKLCGVTGDTGDIADHFGRHLTRALSGRKDLISLNHAFKAAKPTIALDLGSDSNARPSPILNLKASPGLGGYQINHTRLFSLPYSPIGAKPTVTSHGRKGLRRSETPQPREGCASARRNTQCCAQHLSAGARKRPPVWVPARQNRDRPIDSTCHRDFAAALSTTHRVRGIRG